jgi:hypothetical protein
VPNIAKLILGHPVVNTLYLFPIIFALSIIGCLLGTFLTKPEDDAVLMKFYRTVNPWGAWGPIRDKVVAENPDFVPNPNFAKDMTNVAVGIVWQLSLTALPIFIVLREWKWAGLIGLSLAATSVFIKFNWYDRLEKADEPVKPASRQPELSSPA